MSVPYLLPTNRDENWRYANLRPLAKAVPTPVVADACVAPPPRAALPGFESWLCVDGKWIAASSGRAGHQARLLDRREHGEAIGKMLDVELQDAGVDFSLARTNLRHSDNVLVVCPDPGAEFAIEVVCVATQGSAAGTSYPRVQVQASRGSRVRLVERHLGVGHTDSSVNAAIDIGVAAGAQVEHVRLQDYPDKASAFDTLLVNVGEHGRYALRTITLGGLSSRSTAFIRLAGRAARCDFVAASIAGGLQTHDFFAEIDHDAPEAATREIYRGIANERGKLAFNGKMIVRQNAHGADSDQSLKTLLNGNGAEAAARPQLEIYTDKVRARHGATSGKLDDQMLFYLLSRGLERAQAQALLQWAFIEDAVSQVQLAPLRQEIEQLVAARLNETSALELANRS
jgi:Fe-S cluster assembly protein SufD